MYKYSPLFLAAAMLAGCSTAPPPMGMEAQSEARLQNLIDGKVAGQPMSCLAPRRADRMVVIDDNTVAFREGSNVYVNRIQGGCNQLGSGFYALVTRSYGSSGLCRGDIAQVADLTTGTTVGSCVLGDFVPYSRP